MTEVLSQAGSLMESAALKVMHSETIGVGDHIAFGAFKFLLLCGCIFPASLQP
jgi:hypothetical protein